jgi:hypothetical protein
MHPISKYPAKWWKEKYGEMGGVYLVTVGGLDAKVLFNVLSHLPLRRVDAFRCLTEIYSLLYRPFRTLANFWCFWTPTTAGVGAVEHTPGLMAG